MMHFPDPIISTRTRNPACLSPTLAESADTLPLGVCLPVHLPAYCAPLLCFLLCDGSDACAGCWTPAAAAAAAVHSSRRAVSMITPPPRQRWRWRQHPSSKSRWVRSSARSR
jgi:hypothetical protein